MQLIKKKMIDSFISFKDYFIYAETIQLAAR